MIESTTTYIKQHFPVIATYAAAKFQTRWAIGSAAFLAIPVAEMTIRALGNFVALNSNQRDGDRELEIKDFKTNLGCAAFYGFCAVNYIPGTAVMGASLLTVYSLYSLTFNADEDRFSFVNTTSKLCEAFGKKVIVPICKQLEPVAKLLWNVVKVICEIIGAILKPFIGFFGNLKLHRHPEWVGFSALVLASVVYKYSGSIFGKHL